MDWKGGGERLGLQKPVFSCVGGALCFNVGFHRGGHRSQRSRVGPPAEDRDADWAMFDFRHLALMSDTKYISHLSSHAWSGRQAPLFRI